MKRTRSASAARRRRVSVQTVESILEAGAVAVEGLVTEALNTIYDRLGRLPIAQDPEPFCTIVSDAAREWAEACFEETGPVAMGWVARNGRP